MVFETAATSQDPDFEKLLVSLDAEGLSTTIAEIESETEGGSLAFQLREVRNSVDAMKVFDSAFNMNGTLNWSYFSGLEVGKIASVTNELQGFLQALYSQDKEKMRLAASRTVDLIK